MEFMCLSIKYRYSDILLKKKHINFIYNHLLCCNHTCYCVGMISVSQRHVMYRQRHLITRVIKVDPRCTSMV